MGGVKHKSRHTYSRRGDELLKEIAVNETSEAVKTPLWPVLCDSVCLVTVKSDDLVIEGERSQTLSKIPRVSNEDSFFIGN